MRHKGMPSGVTREAAKRDAAFNKALRNQKKLSYEELQKEGADAYDAEVAAQAELVKAYDAKKLRSPRLIKEAKRIKGTNKET